MNQPGLFDALFDAVAPASVKAAKPLGPADRPPGASDVMRPDTKRPKAMGWYVAASHRVDVYLDLVVQRPNEGFRGMSPGALMGMRAAQKKAREWASAALEQAGVAGRARPSRVTLVRISSGHMDDDGLVASFKHVRDACAIVLGFDDRNFSIGGMKPRCVPIFYESRTPGKRAVRGVRIELEWSAT